MRTVYSYTRKPVQVRISEAVRLRMQLEPEVLRKVKGLEEDMRLDIQLSVALQNDELTWR